MLVRAGAFSLTRLGKAIAETWLEKEPLTRQSLVLLTTEMRSKLGEILSEAQSAAHDRDWEQVRQKLRVNVVTLVEGIDRRRQGLDQQQSEVVAQVSTLLAESWLGALEICERLLEETTATLGELKDLLVGETGDLLNLLADIEALAEGAGAADAGTAAREAQLKVDNIGAWGRARHEAWSEYFGAVQRFIREHIRMDPDRAVSRRLQEAISAWPDAPCTLDVADAGTYLHLRQPPAQRSAVPVRREARSREVEPEVVEPRDWEAELATRVAAWLALHPHTTLSEALATLLPEQERFRLAGRITRHLAALGIVTSERERSWVPVDRDLEVEEWDIRLRGKGEK